MDINEDNNKNVIEIERNGLKSQDQKDDNKNQRGSEEKDKEEQYDLNKDWKFLSVLQFVNIFHNVLIMDQISSCELEFSLNHTDIEPLCANILSKLLMKKEIHRPSAKNESQNTQQSTTTAQNSQVVQQNVQNANNQKNSNENNFDINKLNETLIKKINFFYKSYIRFIKRAYTITDMTQILEAVKKDVEIYNNRNDPFALTLTNLGDKCYFDSDTKNYLIIDFFRELGGINPLFKLHSFDKMEQLLNNKPEEEKNELMEDYNSFADLTVKQKVQFLYFFCNYAITISGRAPLYKEEISKSKEEGLLQNKKISPLYTDKTGINYYIFPLNKDCRIYKGKIDVINPIQSSRETFDIVVKNYDDIEKILESENNAHLSKKIKDKLIQFKSNDEEEKKKEQNFLRKQELFEKAKKLSELNTNNISEVEKYKTNDFLLMNISNHVITRNQLNQITKINQQGGHLSQPKHELTEEEKHKLKIERENLERERRMEKRNRMHEKMIQDEKLRFEKGKKYLNKKRENKKKVKGQKKKKWSDDDESSAYSGESDFEEAHTPSDSDEDYHSTTKKNRNRKVGNINTISLRNNTNHTNLAETNNEGDVYLQKKYDEQIINYNNEQQESNSDIINEGYLIYRYSNNQIEIEGNWFVSNDPEVKERISYLFSNSNKILEIIVPQEKINKESEQLKSDNYINVNKEDQSQFIENSTMGIQNNNSNNNIIEIPLSNTQGIMNNQPQVLTQNFHYNNNTNQNMQIQQNISNNNNINIHTQQINIAMPFTVKLCSANLFECITVDALLKNCLDFLNGEYAGYFMYYGKTIEDRMKLTMEIEESLVKCYGVGTNNLGNFNLLGYMNFYRTKEDILEKNNLDDPFIKLAEFKMTKIYSEFNPTENNRVIKSYNHRRKKNNENDYLEY